MADLAKEKRTFVPSYGTDGAGPHDYDRPLGRVINRCVVSQFVRL